ncbi:hypothetical protein A2U01_0036804, partial [Trifolium medium]|nr:hypothetical protein [Trifolium medium]
SKPAASEAGKSEAKVASEEVRTSEAAGSEKVVEEEIPKKPRTKKSKSKRKITPLVVHSSDSEETEEVQPQFKRKKLLLSSSEQDEISADLKTILSILNRKS